MKQIQFLLDHYQLSATQLAEKLGIQRSTISHLLSGRNNPSIDILKRIIHTFPEINESYLLIGTGSPLKQDQMTNKSKMDIEQIDTDVNRPTDLFNTTDVNKVEQEEAPKYIVNKSTADSTSVNNHEIEQILVFYTDGTFKYFRPRE